MKINVLDITQDDVSNGVGVRSAVFLAGCKWECIGCWSPTSWSFDAGKIMTIDEIVFELCKNPMNDGITLTGGDPFYNPVSSLAIIKKVKEIKPEYTIWCWTGFRIEALLKIKDTNVRKILLKEIDVLVDSKFDLTKRDLTLKWRGSSNQRVIDVQESIQRKEIILLENC